MLKLLKETRNILFASLLLLLVEVIFILVGDLFSVKVAALVVHPPLLLILLSRIFMSSKNSIFIFPALLILLTILVFSSITFLDMSVIFMELSSLLCLTVLLALLSYRGLQSFKKSASLLSGMSVNGYLREQVLYIHCTLYILSVAMACGSVNLLYDVLSLVLAIVAYLSLVIRLWRSRPFLIMERYLSYMEKKYGEDFSTIVATDVSYKQIFDRLLALLEAEKCYLNPNISAQELANRLYTNRTYLSKAINIYTNKNFRQLMNQYRINYAIERFKENPALKMSDLAYMSGFNILPSFSTSFKAVVGISPAQWCKNYKASLPRPRSKGPISN